MAPEVCPRLGAMSGPDSVPGPVRVPPRGGSGIGLRGRAGDRRRHQLPAARRARAPRLRPAPGGRRVGPARGAHHPRRRTAPPRKCARAAAEAEADGKSAARAAEEAVGRSGDRWGAVYDKAQYEQYADALDGRYTGVGLWVARTADGRTEVTRVQAGGPAARAGVRSPATSCARVDGWPAERAARHRGGRPAARRRGRQQGRRSTCGAARAPGPGRSTGRSSTPRTSPSQNLSAKAVMIKVAAFTKGSGERVRGRGAPGPQGRRDPARPAGQQRRPGHRGHHRGLRLPRRRPGRHVRRARPAAGAVRGRAAATSTRGPWSC